MSAAKRLGILYGRLGISTDVNLVKRRCENLESLSNEVKLAEYLSIIRAWLQIDVGPEEERFLAKFEEQDPTFDVHVRDKEARLLAAAMIDNAIENNTKIGHLIAFAVSVAAAQGMRLPDTHNELINLAEARLVKFQERLAVSPPNRTYQLMSEATKNAINTVGTSNNGYGSVPSATIGAALTEIGKYAEGRAQAAANSDQVILDYVRNLEQELQLYWWVSSGWSTDAGCPFRQLSLPDAVVRAGKELADKTASQVGIFSAPALLDMVIERGRSPSDSRSISIQETATASPIAWRKDNILSIVPNQFRSVLAVTSALSFAAESNDADDWLPRYSRATGIDAEIKYDAASLAFQIYKEILFIQVFKPSTGE